MAQAPKLATCTVFSLIPIYFLFISSSCFSYIVTYVLHWLPHWTIISICFIVIKELICCKGIFSIATFVIQLFLVEVIVFHKSFNTIIFEIAVVFITAIARIGC